MESEDHVQTVEHGSSKAMTIIIIVAIIAVLIIFMVGMYYLNKKTSIIGKINKDIVKKRLNKMKKEKAEEQQREQEIKEIEQNKNKFDENFDFCNNDIIKNEEIQMPDNQNPTIKQMIFIHKIHKNNDFKCESIDDEVDDKIKKPNVKIDDETSDTEIEKNSSIIILIHPHSMKLNYPVCPLILISHRS